MSSYSRLRIATAAWPIGLSLSLGLATKRYELSGLGMSVVLKNLTSKDSGSKSWHDLDVVAVVRSLDVGLETGLAGDEVKLHQAKFGLNRLTARRGTPAWAKFLQQFNHPLVYIPLTAVGVTAFLGEWLDSSVIFGVVFINAMATVGEGEAVVLATGDQIETISGVRIKFVGAARAFTRGCFHLDPLGSFYDLQEYPPGCID